MKRARRGALLLCLAATSVGMAAGESWTIRDSIEMTYFVTDNEHKSQGSTYTDDAKVTPSPDGKRFFVTTMRGDIEDDAVIYELQVYDVPAVIDALRMNRGAPQPAVAHTVKTREFSGSGLLGIRMPKWTDDSRSIYFIEIDVESHAALKRVHVASRQVADVSEPSKYIDDFKLERGVVLYRERVSDKMLWEESDLPYPTAYVDSEFFQRALSWKIPRYASYIVGADGRARTFGYIEQGNRERDLGRISPDGRWIVAAKSMDRKQRPAAWAGYEIKNDRYADTQFYLFDVATLQERPLLNAPIGWAIGNPSDYKALWSPDSSRVILANTLMPLDGKDARRRDTSYIVEYDVSSASARAVASLPAPGAGMARLSRVEVRWLHPGRELLIEYGEGVTERSIAYAWHKNGWVGLPHAGEKAADEAEAPALWSGLQVQIRQGLNDPPRLMASLDGRTLQLSSEDPVIARASFLPSEKLEWKDARGKPWEGALVLPESSVRASRLPLIIQLGDVRFDRFCPDGVVLRPGHAAQAFAARGYAVLTFQNSRASEVSSASVDELPEFQGGVDAAVRMLEERGLVDPDKVGLIGHSRNGFRSFWIATHPRGFTPAAVAVQDSFSGGYAEYVLAQSLFPRAPGFEPLYSREGLPFWKNKNAWTANAPGFSLENMASPLLLLHLSESLKGPPVVGMLTFMEEYGGLRRLGRPIEAVSFPGGTHNPVQPQHRAANMRLVIDWMDFWIAGKESADAADADRNARWRKMREEWAATKQGS